MLDKLIEILGSYDDHFDNMYYWNWRTEEFAKKAEALGCKIMCFNGDWDVEYEAR